MQRPVKPRTKAAGGDGTVKKQLSAADGNSHPESPASKEAGEAFTEGVKFAIDVLRVRIRTLEHGLAMSLAVLKSPPSDARQLSEVERGHAALLGDLSPEELIMKAVDEVNAASSASRNQQKEP
jgi:hypothetical protein